MRLIFISLLVINIAVAAWGWLYASSSDSGTSQVSNRAGSVNPNDLGESSQIILLSELTAGESEGLGIIRKQFDTSKSAQALEAANGDVAPKLCKIVGPFEVKAQAQELLERLSSIDVKATIETMEFPAGTGFWVYLKPEADRKAALKRLAELQSRGLDSYIIPKGDLINGISLGMYSKKDLADARFKLVEDLKLNPQMETIERKYKELWLMLEPNEAQKMSEITWSRILEDKKNLQRRENYCLDVAS